ncbi:MAG: DUF3800 domain-containing protein [Chloroflexi bacterium]|nr:DUF3800 domain-containing protein [Chloroflexota bacterium]
MPYLYVFLDEAGNFDFSNRPGATEWLTLTSLLTTQPTEGIAELYEAKHNLIDLGHEVEYFHATEDRQVVRDRVFSILANLTSARVDSLAIRKRRLHPDWRDPHQFYPRMLGYLLQYPFDPRGLDVSRFDKVFIFIDRVDLPRRKREALIGGIKRFLKSRLGAVPYMVLMHQSASHLYLQAVDYYSWALFVRRERNEERPWEQIRHRVTSDFDIFASGHRDWY